MALFNKYFLKAVDLSFAREAAAIEIKGLESQVRVEVVTQVRKCVVPRAGV